MDYTKKDITCWQIMSLNLFCAFNTFSICKNDILMDSFFSHQKIIVYDLA